MPFSDKTKREILKQQGGHVIPQEDGTPHHFAHINHDKSRSDYDAPTNGYMTTLLRHFLGHSDSAQQAIENYQNTLDPAWKKQYAFHRRAVGLLKRALKRLGIDIP